MIDVITYPCCGFKSIRVSEGVQVSDVLIILPPIYKPSYNLIFALIQSYSA